MRVVSWQGDQLVLQLYVQPGAKTDGFAGLHDGRLKIRIKAPAIEGQANRYLIAYLAKCFKVSKSSIHIDSGQLGRYKKVTVSQPQFMTNEITEFLQSEI